MIKAIFDIINDGKLFVRVNPNAKKNQIREIRNETLIIDIKAVPEDNKANEELLKFLKKELKTVFVIKSGKTSRNKLLKALEV